VAAIGIVIAGLMITGVAAETFMLLMAPKMKSQAALRTKTALALGAFQLFVSLFA